LFPYTVEIVFSCVTTCFQLDMFRKLLNLQTSNAKGVFSPKHALILNMSNTFYMFRLKTYLPLSIVILGVLFSRQYRYRYTSVFFERKQPQFSRLINMYY
jgi:hypothetical protein